MIIHMLCNDGSPLGVSAKTLWGLDGSIGCGGSEYLMITLCEELAKRGDTVVLYNNPKEPNASIFEQRAIDSYDPNEPRDILINFRSPNPRTVNTHNCKKLWLSTDQMSVGDYRSFASNVDKIVVISPRHAQYFKETYGIQNTIVIDIPVRVQDYEEVRRSERIVKVKNRLLFSSVPARGLDNLLRIYQRIQREVPDVSLTITSDYRLWGVGASNEHFRVKWMHINNVDFIGAVPRAQLIREQLKAQILLYPSNYDELFCVAVSEAQYAGSYPITSATGALPTTNMGKVVGLDANDVHNDWAFVEETVNLLNGSPDHLAMLQHQVYLKAKERFNPERILKEWDNVFGV
jgi:glycosyltransferase involved in cell wall biosynthesis